MVPAAHVPIDKIGQVNRVLVVNQYHVLNLNNAVYLYIACVYVMCVYGPPRPDVIM